MFFEINKYSEEELKTFWQNFADLTNHYTSNERWGEIVPKDDEYGDFLSLTFDNILYSGHNTVFDNDELKNTTAPFMFTSISIILAKKVIFDYGVKQTIPYYEFETYYQTTRLTSVFERTREFSELKEDYKKCEESLLPAYPQEETTLWHVLTSPDLSDKLSAMFDDKEFGFSLIELFTNMLAYDFVRNYLKLNNERRDITAVPVGFNELSDDECGDVCAKEDAYCEEQKEYNGPCSMNGVHSA